MVATRYRCSFRLNQSEMTFKKKLMRNIYLYSFFIYSVLGIGSWVQVPISNPGLVSARNGHMVGFIPQSNELLLMCGFDQADLVRQNDFYSFSLNTSRWTKINKWELVRTFMGYAVDDTTGKFYVHGGYDGSFFYNDFWVFDSLGARSWVELSTPNRLTERSNHCLLFDRSGNRLVLFGGYGQSADLNDLWYYSLSSNSWTAENNGANGAPGLRHDHACSLEATGDLYVHGGNQRSSPSLLNDLWKYSFQRNSWSRLNIGQSEVTLFGHAMVYVQQLNSLVILLGGSPTAPYSNNVFQYNLSMATTATWRLVSVSGSKPLARQWFASSYDMKSGKIYISSGQPAGSDLWSFDLHLVQPLSSSQASSTVIPVSTRASVPFSSSSYSSSPIVQASPSTGPSVSSEATPTSRSPAPTSSAVPNLPIIPSPRSSTKSSKAADVTTVILTVPFSFSQWITTNFLDRWWAIAVLALILVLCALFIIIKLRKFRKRKLAANAGSELYELTDNEKIGSAESSMSLGNTKERYLAVSNHPSEPNSEYLDSGELTKVDETAIDASQTATSSSMKTISVSVAGLAIPGYAKYIFGKDFIIETQIARGGFGTVHLAKPRHQELKNAGVHDHLVVKKLEIENMSEKHVNWFYQEVSIMELLKKEENVVKFLGYTDNPYCILMKFYSFGTLAKWIKSSKVKKSKLLLWSFALDVACGLRSIHRQGIAHCDIKTANILVDYDPKGNYYYCVITDFGMAQVVTSKNILVDSFKLTNVNGGSKPYMAPEVFEKLRSANQLFLANTSELMFSDIFSFSILLFELITRSRVYKN